MGGRPTRGGKSESEAPAARRASAARDYAPVSRRAAAGDGQPASARPTAESRVGGFWRFGPDAEPGGAAVRLLRRLVAVLVLAEGALLVAVGGVLAVALFSATPDHRAPDATLALISWVAGAGLIVIGRGVSASRSWSRSPVLVWQLIQAAAAGSDVVPGGWPVRAPLLAAAILAGLGVLVGGVVAADRRGQPRDSSAGSAGPR